MPWSKPISIERTQKSYEGLRDMQVLAYTPNVDWKTIPLNVAYVVDAVHVFVDIPTARNLIWGLHADDERAHKAVLRFLHLYQRVADVVLARTGSVKVDFQNHRLHFIVTEPADNEFLRLSRAVAIGSLIHDVLRSSEDLQREVDSVATCIGIETGKCLLVRNGTRGEREPLFIGNAVNFAAKRSGVEQEGIFLGERAAGLRGSGLRDPLRASGKLSDEQVAQFVAIAALPLRVEEVIKAWEEEKKRFPIADFSFTRPTLPLSGLDFDQLSPANSKRLELVSLFADIDGFTKYVAQAIDTGGEAVIDAARCLHVIRKELRDVVCADFRGAKFRYIGDCIHAGFAEGTASSTDPEKTIEQALLCAGALRDAFGVIQADHPSLQALGIQIGLEYGPVGLSRLGVKGRRDRQVVGNAVHMSQDAQESCNGRETEVGQRLLSAASAKVKELFQSGRKRNDLTYNKVSYELGHKGLDASGSSTVAAMAVTPGYRAFAK